MGVLGVLFLTLSAATPASSIFVIVPDILAQAGTGALVAMAGAAAIAACVSVIYAELCSAFPFSGGEYAIVGRVLGPLAGFVVLALNLLNTILGGAVLALGVSGYLAATIPGMPAVPTAVAVFAGATALGVLNIRTNALVTGLFVAVEIAALAVLAWLGFAHVARDPADLFAHPLVMAGAGRLAPAPAVSVGMAIAVAIFAYDGYGSAVYFGEEMRRARARIAGAILIACAVIAAAEFLPLLGVLAGAPDLAALLGSSSPLIGFVRGAAGSPVAEAMAVGVALAIVNAVIAIVLLSARQLYSTGRDATWPGPLNRALTRIHPRFRSPWVATLAAGAIGAGLCFVDLKLLLIATGTGITLVYAILCLALLAGRRTGVTAGSFYRQPWAPLVAALTLVALAGVVWADWADPSEGRPGLFVSVAIAAVAALYYGIVLRRRGGWTLVGPDDPDG
ncbi:MAG: APC family permease [Caulobacteraceae bacterium]|nr:APC family permease [Caulobacteraceae bacterium]